MMGFWALPLWLFSFWTLLACLGAERFLGWPLHELFLLFLLALFGSMLGGRLMILDALAYPSNLLASPLVPLTLMVWGRIKLGAAAPPAFEDEKLPAFCFGLTLMAISVFCLWQSKSLFRDPAVQADGALRGFFAVTHFMQVFSSLYFFRRFRRFRRG